MGYHISEDNAASIDQLLHLWIEIKLELEERFKKRESEHAIPAMNKAIELFIEFLFLSNDKESIDKTDIELCAIRPVNVVERLDFIIARPRLYHSYIQLCELFSEQEKMYARQKVLHKLQKKRPD